MYEFSDRDIIFEQGIMLFLSIAISLLSLISFEFSISSCLFYFLFWSSFIIFNYFYLKLYFVTLDKDKVIIQNLFHKAEFTLDTYTIVKKNLIPVILTLVTQEKKIHFLLKKKDLIDNFIFFGQKRILEKYMVEIKLRINI